MQLALSVLLRALTNFLVAEGKPFKRFGQANRAQTILITAQDHAGCYNHPPNPWCACAWLNLSCLCADACLRHFCEYSGPFKQGCCHEMCALNSMMCHPPRAHALLRLLKQRKPLTPFLNYYDASAGIYSTGGT